VEAAIVGEVNLIRYLDRTRASIVWGRSGRARHRVARRVRRAVELRALGLSDEVRQ
jgi:hypothetical protein